MVGPCRPCRGRSHVTLAGSAWSGQPCAQPTRLRPPSLLQPAPHLPHPVVPRPLQAMVGTCQRAGTVRRCALARQFDEWLVRGLRHGCIFSHHSCISGHGAWRKGRAKCSMLVQGADRDLVKIWQKMHAKRFDNIVLKAKTVSAQATPDGMEATVPSSCCSTIHRKRKARARFLAAAWSANKGLRVSAMHAASIKPPLALHLAQKRRQWR